MDEENPYGEGVLRVSSIANSFKPDIEGLLRWAANSKGAYAKDRASACDIGNCVHKFAEAVLAQSPPIMAEAKELYEKLNALEKDKANKANTAFTNWLEPKKLIPTHLEIKMNNYDPIEDPTMPNIGGTCDFIGYVNDRFVMIDWKSSKSLNRGYCIQLAGYKYLYELNFPQAPKIEGFYGLRLDKFMGHAEEYDFTPWMEEAEWRFKTSAKMLAKWPHFTTLDH